MNGVVNLIVINESDCQLEMMGSQHGITRWWFRIRLSLLGTII
jgi:hypothetical protein